jgi:DNA-binding transcriptional LysR family regulator
VLNLHHVETWLTVLATGSFHEASRRLGLAQSTVSQHVQKLEASLRAPLVERNGTGCQPTPQGRALRPHAEALLRLSRRAEEAVNGGRLAIGASGNVGTYLLPDLLRTYQATSARSPQVEIGTNPYVIGRLEAGEIDVALVEWWEARPGLIAHAWRREPLVVIVGPDHAWSTRRSVTLGDLEGRALLGGEPGSGTGRLLREAMGATGANLSIDRQLGSTEAVKRAVRAGIGISIVMACSVIDEVRAELLVALPLQGIDLTKTLFAAHRYPLPETTLADGFIAALA